MLRTIREKVLGEELSSDDLAAAVDGHIRSENYYVLSHDNLRGSEIEQDLGSNGWTIYPPYLLEELVEEREEEERRKRLGNKYTKKKNREREEEKKKRRRRQQLKLVGQISSYFIFKMI